MTSDNGLPKVEGLEQVLADNAMAAPVADKGNAVSTPMTEQAATPITDGQVKEMSEDEILAQFKSTKDLLKSYKEIQGFTTRVSQENKAKDKVIAELQENLSKMKDEIELRSYTSQQPVIPPAQSFEQMFIENPEQAITMKASQIANTQRISEVLEDEETKNPQEFKERMAFVQMLAQNRQYAPLSYSPKGVKKLFEIADKERKDSLAKQAHGAIKMLFGDDVDLEKFKALVRKDQQSNTNIQPTTANPLRAYMPDNGTSTRTGADTNMAVNELERIKAEAVRSGDASAVAGAVLKQALLK